MLRHLNPIHARHPNIRQQDVRAFSAQKFQPCLAVGRIAYDNAVHAEPVDRTDKPLANDLFVLNDENTPHHPHLPSRASPEAPFNERTAPLRR